MRARERVYVPTVYQEQSAYGVPGAKTAFEALCADLAGSKANVWHAKIATATQEVHGDLGPASVWGGCRPCRSLTPIREVDRTVLINNFTFHRNSDLGLFGRVDHPSLSRYDKCLPFLSR